MTKNAEDKMSDSPENQKWTCQLCTYLNYPASKKCVMCQSEKILEKTTAPQKIQAVIEHQKFNLENALSIQVCQSPSHHPSNLPHHQISPKPGNSQAQPNLLTSEEQKTDEKVEKLLKWKCQLCTYENHAAGSGSIATLTFLRVAAPKVALDNIAHVQNFLAISF